MKIHPTIPKATVEKLLAKSKPMLSACIGERKTMRLDAKTTISGIIVAAEVDAIEDWGRTARVIFKVVLECGANKTRREFRCQQLPI